MKFSVFPNITQPGDPHTIAIQTAFERISSDKNLELIQQIRQFPEKKDRDELKKKLAAYTFSGVFTYRNAKSLVEHSGLLCIDFDNLSEGALIDLKSKLTGDKFTHLLFVSPSGNGLKLVIKIPASPETHSLSCKAAFDYYDSPQIDSLEDVCRVCYDSYDPDCYFNLESEAFVELAKPKEIARPAQVTYRDDDKVFDSMVKWVNEKRGKHFSKGQRNQFVCSLASALCRCGIDREVAIDMLCSRYLEEDFPEREITTVARAAYRAYEAYFGTFEPGKNELLNKTTGKPVEPDEKFDMSSEPKDVIMLRDIEDLMLDRYDNGAELADTTYSDVLDERWKWRKGDLNVIFGFPNHGKSTWWMHQALVKSLFDGDRWAIFSPEQYPPVDFYTEMIEMYYGRSLKKHHHNHITRTEYKQAMEFLNEYFYFIYPENDNPTPEYLNDKIAELVIKKNVTGAVRDPFNQEAHDDVNMRDDKYISKYLKASKRFIQNKDTKIYYIIAAHPDKNSAAMNKDGELVAPHMYSIAGGAMWPNIVDNMISIHRPYRVKEHENPLVEVHVQKVKKQKIVGIPGLIEASFNYKESRYYYGNRNAISDYWKTRGGAPVPEVPAQPLIHTEYEETPF